jgi:hypothetical protein
VVAIVSHGLSLERAWLFVTMSNFQERVATVTRLSVDLYLWLNPVVPEELREECEIALNGRPADKKSLRGFDAYNLVVVSL